MGIVHLAFITVGSITDIDSIVKRVICSFSVILI